MRIFAIAGLALLVAACQVSAPLRDSDFKPVADVRGPQSGRPAILYMFGGSGYTPRDQVGLKTPQILDQFVKSGFDVYRLNLSALDQSYGSRSARRTEQTLSELRGMGYARIYVIGQSAGGHDALKSIGGQHPLADGAIAFAPGFNSRLDIRVQETLFNNVVSNVSPTARVAIFLFDDDAYFGNWQAQQITIAKRYLADRTNAMVIVPSRVRGHVGAYTEEFADDFGACLARFLDTDVAVGNICNSPTTVRQ